MAHALADETLKDILSRVLDVPDADFASDEGVSPFALRQFSTADVLLACKRWMRVATPLLYHTVVLRSTAQAQALAKALKKNPGFGVYLKKLRIEGGFGASVGASIRAASGITDLCISLSVGPKDNFKSTSEALPSMRPRRLVLFGLPSSTAAPVRMLREGLMSAIPMWHTLKCVAVSTYCVAQGFYTVILPCLGPNVEELCLTGPRLTISIARILVSLLSRLPSVHVVRLQASDVDDRFDEQAQRIVFGTHYSKLVLTAAHDSIPSPLPTQTMDASSSYVPMQASPRGVRRAIWTLVFEHVLFSQQPFPDSRGTAAFLSMSLQEQQRLSVSTALSHMCVCKLFKDVIIVLAARAVRLSSTRRWDAFAALLHEKPHLAASVRGVFVSSTSSRLDFEHQVLETFTGLRRFAGENISLSSLVILSRGAGSTLHQLELRSLNAASTLLPLQFPVLRRLQVTKFVGQPLPQLIWDIPLLEELDIEESATVLLSSFIPLELPYLSYLCLSTANTYYGSASNIDRDTLTPFLAKHGHKCTELRFSGSLDQALPHCPHLRVLHMSHGMLSCQKLDTDSVRLPALAKLYAPNYYDWRRKKDGRAIDERWAEFFDLLGRGRSPNPGPACTFPALLEVSISSLKWPTQPQEIAQSRMVRWAEEMQAKGIRVLAQDGTAWRTRLKTKK